MFKALGAEESNMRLYVIDQSTAGKKIHLKQTAESRASLAAALGSQRIKVGEYIYTIDDVIAEPSENAAAAMALGGVVGVAGGVPGVIIGGIIGGLLGSSADKEDKVKVLNFNRSTSGVY